MVKPAARLSVVVGDVAANYDGRVVVAPTGQAVDVAVREGAGDVGYSVERENLPADDPVRNGNRWRVIAVDTEHHRIAARRLGDGARAAFSGDYLHEHITHGYAITVHASQGTTAHSTH
ncbi:hypothetical protein, partial [Mycobacterium tuberculosis]